MCANILNGSYAGAAADQTDPFAIGAGDAEGGLVWNLGNPGDQFEAGLGHWARRPVSIVWRPEAGRTASMCNANCAKNLTPAGCWFDYPDKIT